MTTYSNPYYGAWYLGQGDISAGPVPLQPCKDAYSLGPSLTDTALDVRWISYGFNWVSTLQCNLIKDDQDVFYYLTGYYGLGDVYISYYDGPNDTDGVYTVTEPEEFADAGFDFAWMLRKRSETELDCIVRGTPDSGTTIVIQHYVWTIGEGTMTYVDGISITLDDYTGNLFTALHGNAVLFGYYKSSIYYIDTYHLDTQVKDTITVLDPTGKDGGVVGFYYGGAYFFTVVFYSLITATGTCEEMLGGTRTVRITCTLNSEITNYDEDGVGSTDSDVVDTVNGHDCYFGFAANAISADVGIKPEGTVYFKLSYNRAWSGENCPVEGCPAFPYVPGFPGEPDEAETVAGVYSITSSNHGWIDYSETGISPISSGGGWASAVGPTKFNLPGRSDPCSLSDFDGDGLTNIVHWPDLTEGSEGIFTPGYYGGPIGEQVSEGGQRNDNSPISLSTHYRDVGAPYVWHNVVRDLNGDIYLDQTSDLTGGATTKYLPVTGYMGKWPVRFYEGRWAIFGPNALVARGPNWQVV